MSELIPFSKQSKEFQKRLQWYRDALSVESIEDMKRVYAELSAKVDSGELDQKVGEVIRKILDSAFAKIEVFMNVKWPEQAAQEVESAMERRDEAFMLAAQKYMSEDNFKRFSEQLPERYRLSIRSGKDGKCNLASR